MAQRHGLVPVLLDDRIQPHARRQSDPGDTRLTTTPLTAVTTGGVGHLGRAREREELWG